jgi:hypothetical protein
VPDPHDVLPDRTSDHYPLVQDISVGDDGGLIVTYTIPAYDMKANGLMQQHQLIIPAGEDYDDEIAAVLDATVHLIRDALDDLPRLMSLPDAIATYAQDEEEEEDDDR